MNLVSPLSVHQNVSKEIMTSSVQEIGYTVDGKGEDFHWNDGSVWKQSAHNTKWCLVGCSIGDFGTIAAFQFVFIDSGWTPMMIMALAMFNGIMTSIALETFILSAQMALKEAFRVAIGMSLNLDDLNGGCNEYCRSSVDWRCQTYLVGYHTNAHSRFFNSLAV